MDRDKNDGTLGFELLGRNIAPQHFKTRKVAETAYAQRDFDQLWVDFQQLRG